MKFQSLRCKDKHVEKDYRTSQMKMQGSSQIQDAEFKARVPKRMSLPAAWRVFLKLAGKTWTSQSLSKYQQFHQWQAEIPDSIWTLCWASGHHLHSFKIMCALWLCMLLWPFLPPFSVTQLLFYLLLLFICVLPMLMSSSWVSGICCLSRLIWWSFDLYEYCGNQAGSRTQNFEIISYCRDAKPAT